MNVRVMDDGLYFTVKSSVREKSKVLEAFLLPDKPLESELRESANGIR